MSRATYLLLAVVAACGTQNPEEPGEPPPGSASLSPSEIDELLAAHNAVRASASPTPSPALEPLTWSTTAAATAEAWANGCSFKHNSGRGALGENLAANMPPGRSPTQVVNSWASEAANYAYASNTCTAVCGHYTQVVWRTTREVGCAKRTCPASTSPFNSGGEWELWVCNYAPPGNYVGQRPY